MHALQGQHETQSVGAPPRGEASDFCVASPVAFAAGRGSYAGYRKKGDSMSRPFRYACRSPDAIRGTRSSGPGLHPYMDSSRFASEIICL